MDKEGSGRRKAPDSATVENLHAPEVYAANAAHFSILSNVVTVTLVAPRWDMSTEPPTLRAAVVGRLSMPTEGAERLVAGLGAFLRGQPLASTRPGERGKPN